MLDGVLQHVHDQPPQQVLIATQLDFRQLVDHERTPRCRASEVQRAGALRDDFVQIEIDEPERIRAGIGTGQHEHVFDQTSEPRRSPLITVTASRYSASSRWARLSVTSAVVWTTDTGVRSSCDASAMNWRCVASASRSRRPVR